MRVCVVIPVGPGHLRISEESIASVERAAKSAPLEVAVRIEYDTEGLRGRSLARNEGAASVEADWYLFHDSDDLLQPDAFETLSVALREDPARELVWGEFWKERPWRDADGGLVRMEFLKCEGMATPISTWEGMLEAGPLAGSRHGFVSAALFRRIGGWFTPMDIGEDLEFVWAAAAHARSFVKVAKPICRSRLYIPAASGPRGYDRNVQTLTPEWSEPGWRVYRYWKARGRLPWSTEERAARARGENYLAEHPVHIETNEVEISRRPRDDEVHPAMRSEDG